MDVTPAGNFAAWICRAAIQPMLNTLKKNNPIDLNRDIALLLYRNRRLIIFLKHAQVLDPGSGFLRNPGPDNQTASGLLLFKVIQKIVDPMTLLQFIPVNGQGLKRGDFTRIKNR